MRMFCGGRGNDKNLQQIAIDLCYVVVENIHA